MSEPSITCPSCGKKIPLTRALRTEIETSVKDEYERRLADEVERARKQASKDAEKKSAHELAALKDELDTQTKDLERARQTELALRKRERDLERKQQDLELTVARKLDEERNRVVVETETRLAEQQRLKDAEKERQLAGMRRQIEDLKRKADQGSQQLQGEAGEDELESSLRATFPWDDIAPVPQGIRGADLHQTVVDARGSRCGTILWECKNAKNWSEGWIAKLREDQRTLRADVAILVTASLPKGCANFSIIEGVVVTSFACAAAVASLVRAQLMQLTQTRSAVVNKDQKLELLYRYLSGIEFRQRVEAIVEAFGRMRDDLDQERRATERLWAKRLKQIEAVSFNIAGMYGDLQGLVPTLPSIGRLELPEPEVELVER
ncbi:MAG TPA: DUF2130 domain-containing protein [Vicinamibacterales bacterium]|nr:DUF2130 domain-containing protein [Vicinamibacterales bacterium]